MKIKVKNVSPAPLRDKKPGDVFRIEVDDAGSPTDSYWRRRMDEKAIEVAGAASSVADPSPAPEPVEDPVPSPAAPVARRSPASKKD